MKNENIKTEKIVELIYKIGEQVFEEVLERDKETMPEDMYLGLRDNEIYKDIFTSGFGKGYAYALEKRIKSNE